VSELDFKNMCIKDILAVVQYERNYHKPFTIEPRNMHFLGIMMKGKSVITLGEKKFLSNVDCVYFFNQKDRYTCDVLEAPSKSFSIHFTTTEPLYAESFVFPVSNSTKIINLLQKAEKAKISNNILELYSLTYAICSEIGYLREKQYFPKDKRMTDAKEYIDEHFNNQDCLDEVINRSGVCARRFCEVFRKVYNITPNKYIIQRKIEYAKSLLSTGGFSVSDVSSICNFSDVYYFSKVFKKHTGISPSKYKDEKLF
jgi:AraC-like DNA-binding protein